jgi:tetratricopeptide (TPR) repeat protein
VTEISRQPLPSVLAELSARRATGALVVTSGDEVREVLFTRGEVRAARSHVEEEKLGKWLVSRGKISEDDRALILLAQGGGQSPPLGHILVTRGYLTGEALEEELEALALTIIERASGASRSVLEYVDGGGEGQLDTLPNVVTSQVVLMAARACSDVDAIQSVIGQLDRPIMLAGNLNALLEEVQLTPTEGFLLSRIDGASNVGSLIKLSSIPEAETYATLYTLMMAGVVEVAGEIAPSIDVPEPGPADEPTPEPMHDDELQVEGDEIVFTERQLEERRYIRRLSEDITKVDHYRALGIKRDAKPNEIKDAWDKIRTRFSPDKSGAHLRDMAPHLERIIERGRVAYDVLSAYRDRKRYDAILDSMERQRPKKQRDGKSDIDPVARKELVEANLKRADELVKQDELYLAIQLLEQACALDPRPHELLKLARLLQRNPLWVNRSLACMRRAIEANPRFVEAWLELADFWRRRNHSERQRKSLERALAIDPDNELANQMYKELAGARELQRLLRRARQMR